MFNLRNENVYDQNVTNKVEQNRSYSSKPMHACKIVLFCQILRKWQLPIQLIWTATLYQCLSNATLY